MSYNQMQWFSDDNSDSFTHVMYCFIVYDWGINLASGENILHEWSEIDQKE